MFLHVSIEYWNTIRHISYFLKLFWGEHFLHMQIVPSFTAVNLLLKSNQNDSEFTWLELVHTFLCADDMIYWNYASSHFMLRSSKLCKHKMCVAPNTFGHGRTEYTVCWGPPPSGPEGSLVLADLTAQVQTTDLLQQCMLILDFEIYRWWGWWLTDGFLVKCDDCWVTGSTVLLLCLWICLA